MSGTVLLIHNDQERRRLVHAELEPRGHIVLDGAYGASTLDLTVTTRPDLVIVDSQVAGSLPPNFLDSMATDIRISDVPVLIANTTKLLDLVVNVEVQLELSKAKANAPAHFANINDELTGLYSASQMKHEITHAEAIARRYNQSLSVVLLGLDRFERTNRMYGNDAGNEVLQDVGARLSTDVRDSDIVGRWQGDQFLAILPCTSKAGAGFLAERFREILAESQHMLNDGSAVSITASFGCAGVEDGDVMNAAENALKIAKRSGRNAVALS